MGIKARIGLFGGSFNPVHKGHLRVAEEVKEKLKLDGVVFIPAAIPYHRAIEGTTPAQRYRMLCLAAEGTGWIKVSKIEMEESARTGRPVATVHTVAKMKEKYGKDTRLFFIAGSDEGINLCEWKDPGKLLGLCSFVVVERPGYDKHKLPKGYLDRIEVLEIGALDISSSEIRKLLENGGDAGSMLPVKVADFIKKKGLYRQGT